MATITEHRANAVLDKVFRYEEGVMSRRDWLALKVSQGAKAQAETVPDDAKIRKIESEIEYWRGRCLRLGEVSPVAELKAQLAAKPTKLEYRLNENDGRSWPITKTEYDYLNR